MPTSPGSIGWLDSQNCMFCESNLCPSTHPAKRPNNKHNNPAATQEHHLKHAAKSPWANNYIPALSIPLRSSPTAHFCQAARSRRGVSGAPSQPDSLQSPCFVASKSTSSWNPRCWLSQPPLGLVKKKKKTWSWCLNPNLTAEILRSRFWLAQSSIFRCPSQVHGPVWLRRSQLPGGPGSS